MSLGLLVLRLLAGALFAGHGAQKLFGAFGGAGLEATAAGFEKGGLNPGRLHARAAGCAELGAGLLLALGLLVPFAAAALIAVMTAAVVTVHLRNGVWASNGGYEYNVVLAAIGFSLAAGGPGDWSLDHALGLGLAGAEWAVGALAAGLLGGTLAVLYGRHQSFLEARHHHAGAH